MEQPKKEICTIRIMFPVESDEKAIEVKAKINEILSGNEEAQVQFSTMTAPTRPPLGT